MLTQYLYSILLGIIQGITEFIPISSSGHLVVLHNIFPQAGINELTFDIVLHFGTLCAVVIYFFKDLKAILINWLKSIVKQEMSPEAKLGWLLILATVPAVLAGYFFESYIEAFLRSNLVVAAMLVIIGLFFILAEKYALHQNESEKIGWKQALLIGVAQAVALIPGTSRSGITIIAGMSTKLKREAAVRFSFLMSVPVIFGATIKKIPPMSIGAIFAQDVFNFILGFIMSFIFGFIAIKYLLIYVKNNSLNVFAYYRFLLAVIILAIWFF